MAPGLNQSRLMNDLPVALASIASASIASEVPATADSTHATTAAPMNNNTSRSCTIGITTSSTSASSSSTCRLPVLDRHRQSDGSGHSSNTSQPAVAGTNTLSSLEVAPQQAETNFSNNNCNDAHHKNCNYDGRHSKQRNSELEEEDSEEEGERERLQLQQRQHQRQRKHRDEGTTDSSTTASSSSSSSEIVIVGCSGGHAVPKMPRVAGESESSRDEDWSERPVALSLSKRRLVSAKDFPIPVHVSMPGTGSTPRLCDNVIDDINNTNNHCRNHCEYTLPTIVKQNDRMVSSSKVPVVHNLNNNNNNSSSNNASERVGQSTGTTLSERESSSSTRFTPSLVVLTSTEIDILAKRLWDKWGMDSIRADVPSVNQSKFEITRRFFYDNGYLHMDPLPTDYEKIKYILHATEEQKQELYNLDVRAIASSSALIDRRNLELHVVNATSTMEFPQQHSITAVDRKHRIRAEENRQTCTSTTTTANANTGNRTTVDPSPVVPNTAKTNATTTDNLYVKSLNADNEMVDRGNATGMKTSTPPFVPTQAILTSSELEELSRKILQSISQASKDRNRVGGTRDFGRIKLLVTRAYFSKKGYLNVDKHDDYKKNPAKKEYLENATRQELLRMKGLDSSALFRAIASCDRSNHEMIMQITGQTAIRGSQKVSTITNDDVGTQSSSALGGYPQLNNTAADDPKRQKNSSSYQKFVADVSSLLRPISFPDSNNPKKNHMAKAGQPRTITPRFAGLNDPRRSASSINRTEILGTLASEIYLSTIQGPFMLTKEDKAALLRRKEQEINCAMNIVARSLQSGPWPSPARSFEADEIHQRNVSMSLSDLICEHPIPLSGIEDMEAFLGLIDGDNDENGISRFDGTSSSSTSSNVNSRTSGTNLAARNHREYEKSAVAHHEHMVIVVSSLKQFTQDVIKPKMMEEIQASIDIATVRNERYTNGPLHVFLGSLLMLREVMTQNAVEIFGPTAALTGNEAEFTTIAPEPSSDVHDNHNATSAYTSHTNGTSNTNSNGTNGFASKRTEDEVQNSIYTAKILSTAVIVSGLTDLGESIQVFADKFLEIVSQYDRGDDEFASCYQEVDNNVIPVFPSNQPLPADEAMVWRISANLNRKRHPVVRENRKRKKRKKLMMMASSVHSRIGGGSRSSGGGGIINTNQGKNGHSSISTIVDVVEDALPNQTKQCWEEYPLVPVTLPEATCVHISILENYVDGVRRET